MKHQLIERLHFVGDSPWVYYELLGVPLGDFPDDGKCVIMEVVSEIRKEFGVGLSDAKKIWDERKVEL